MQMNLVLKVIRYSSQQKII